jgi:predicted dehydrogenase
MINIAQIGVGYWGPNLLRNCVANKTCQVCATVDPDSDRREYVRGLYPNVRVTSDAEEVFADPGIDAVVIATPVASHYDLAIKALTAGKHILVEKPMARSVDEVNDIARLSAEKGLVAMVGHTFLFNDAVRYVKKLIDSGELGDVRYIYSQRLNLGRIRSDVDALWNLAPHDVSIIQYWLDDAQPISLIRRGVACIQDGIEDVVFMNIMYPNDVMANIHVSWLDPQKTRLMVVVGSKKMVIYDDTAKNKIAIHDKGIETRYVPNGNENTANNVIKGFEYRSGDVLIPEINFREPLEVEIDHFLECITNGITCIAGVDHAKRVVEILSAPTI